MAAYKPTIATLEQKLDGFMSTVIQHMDDDRIYQRKLSDLLDGNGKPGIKTRIEILELKLELKEKTDLERVKWYKTLWGISISALLGVITKFFVG